MISKCLLFVPLVKLNLLYWANMFCWWPRAFLSWYASCHLGEWGNRLKVSLTRNSCCIGSTKAASLHSRFSGWQTQCANISFLSSFSSEHRVMAPAHYARTVHTDMHTVLDWKFACLQKADEVHKQSIWQYIGNGYQSGKCLLEATFFHGIISH